MGAIECLARDPSHVHSLETLACPRQSLAAQGGAAIMFP
jgi:hypothetical protein